MVQVFFLEKPSQDVNSMEEQIFVNFKDVDFANSNILSYSVDCQQFKVVFENWDCKIYEFKF